MPVWLAAATLVLTLPPAVEALEYQPFYTRNQHPLVQIFGLPPAESARLLEESAVSASLTADIANHFVQETGGGEELVLDGETYRYTLALRYGWAESLELGADLPWVDHGGGTLDGFIDSWHSSFGFPDGGRDQAPKDRLLYRYQAGGVERLRVTEAEAGFGDLLLTAGYQVLNRPRTDLALRAGLKLPTGSTAELRSSGGTDGSLRLSLAHQPLGPDFTLFGSAGVLLLSEGDILPGQQREVVWFGSLGTGWRAAEWLELKVQLDGHSKFYDSGLDELGGASGQLVLGGTLRLPRRTELTLAVVEDVVVDTAPDVVFHLSLRKAFGP